MFQKNPKLTESSNPSDELLTACYFEHCIRQFYRGDFIEGIVFDMSIKDDFDYFRKLALDTLTDCIKSKPECEELILAHLVNKLGDSSKKVQLHATACLMQLQKSH